MPESKISHAINEENPILYSIVQMSPHSIVIVEVDGTISMVNRKFTEMCKKEHDDIIGKKWDVFFSTGTSLGDNRSEIIENVFNQKKIWTGDVSVMDENGDAMWKRSTVFPVLDAQGNLLRVVYICEDITEAKIKNDELFLTEENIAGFLFPILQVWP